MHDLLASQPRARKEQRGLGAENGLRGRELRQKSRIPRRQGIEKIHVNVFKQWQRTWMVENFHSFRRLI